MELVSPSRLRRLRSLSRLLSAAIQEGAGEKRGRLQGDLHQQVRGRRARRARALRPTLQVEVLNAYGSAGLSAAAMNNARNTRQLAITTNHLTNSRPVTTRPLPGFAGK